MDDCTLWAGAVTHNGYGKRTVRTRLAGRTVRAHVYAYEQVHGPVPVGLEVSHLCGVRLCINIEHLVAETHAENMARARTDVCRHGRVKRSGRCRCSAAADSRRYRARKAVSA